jgi:hypothetical protein
VTAPADLAGRYVRSRPGAAPSAHVLTPAREDGKRAALCGTKTVQWHPVELVDDLAAVTPCTGCDRAAEHAAARAAAAKVTRPIAPRHTGTAAPARIGERAHAQFVDPQGAHAALPAGYRHRRSRWLTGIATPRT